MNVVSPLLDEFRRLSGIGTTNDAPVVLPDQPLVASVWSDPPEVPPRPLVPYVLPVVENGRLRDWAPTSDVIAFADVTVPHQYAEWRSTWVSAWMLDPSNSARRLLALAAESTPEKDLAVWRRSISSALGSDRGGWVRHDDLVSLESESELLRVLVRERDEIGYGIVDATSGRVAPGLAYAWSTFGGPELIASNDQMKVWMTPDRGLVVTLAPGDANDRPIDIEVIEVAYVEDVAVIESHDSTWEISLDRAKPLAWLVPGALRWRVKQIPEVIVWSKTLTSLPECVENARASELPIWVGTDTPLMARSAAVSDS